MEDVEDVVFYGKNGQECEDFIRAVRKAGFHAKKIRDDAWMADFASTCLTGRALRYYESLSPDVQGDWRLLRQALLKEYPPAEPDASSAQAGVSSHSQAPTPASAAPPPPSQNRRGRIKVRGTDGSDFGYLGYGAAATTSNLGAGFSQIEALSISYVPVGQSFEIEIEQVAGTRQVLGLCWYSSPQSNVLGSGDYAAVAALDCNGTGRSSSMTWSGPKHTSVWSVGPGNALVAQWKDGSQPSILEYMIYTSLAYKARAVDTVLDAAKFCKNHSGSSWSPASIFIEPLSSVA